MSQSEQKTPKGVNPLKYKMGRRVEEQSERIYDYEMKYENTGAIFNRQTMMGKIEEQQKEIERLKYWEQDGKNEISYYINKAKSLEKEIERLQIIEQAYEAMKKAL